VSSIQNSAVGYNETVAPTGSIHSTQRPRATAPTRAEIAQRLFDAFNARDLSVALSLLHPEILFEPVSGAVLNDGEPYRGQEGMRRYFLDVQQHWQELTVDPVHLREAGEAVVALGHVSGRSAAGSLQDAPTTWVFKFDGGLVAHIQVFSDERLARRALGL
jgi:ketosteroid isomerase-like protein